MKKLFTTFSLMLALVFTATAQQNVLIDVWTNPAGGTQVGNYPLYLDIMTNPPIHMNVMTNANGRYYDTLPGVPVGTIIYVHTYDCNGATIGGQFTVNVQPYTTGDTLIIGCPAVGGYPAGVDFQYVLNGNTVDFTNHSFQKYMTHPVRISQFVEYEWKFGDGTTSSLENPSHTYSSPGAYFARLTMTVHDSMIPQRVLYTGTFMDSVFIAGNPTATYCTAAFDVDTGASGNGTVYIWNNSTAGANASIVFHEWNFGDGNTSYNAFPIHSYTSVGSYNLCLTITAFDGLDTCVSTYCETLNVDSAGNVFKNGAGFQLVVLDPATSGLNESNATKASVYPNPAQSGEAFYVELPNASAGEVQWEIYDLRGSALLSGSADTDANSSFMIDLNEMNSGFYLLKLNYNGKTSSHQLQVR